MSDKITDNVVSGSVSYPVSCKVECPGTPDPLPPGYCRAGGNSQYYTCSSEPTNTEILAAVKKADTTDYVMILAAVILVGVIVLVSWLIGMNEKLDKLVKRYAPND